MKHPCVYVTRSLHEGHSGHLTGSSDLMEMSPFRVVKEQQNGTQEATRVSRLGFAVLVVYP